MLILTRHDDESVMIGHGNDLAEVVIVKARNGKVRIGIKAPAHVPVHRKEIHERITEAAGSTARDSTVTDDRTEAITSARTPHDSP